MAGLKGKCCEKQFLYEIETPGLLYLSLDGRDPVYISFQHKLKLEVRLVHPEGISKNVLNSGKLKPFTPWVNTINQEDFTEEASSKDLNQRVLGGPEKPEGPISSARNNHDSDHEVYESLSFTSENFSNSALKQQDARELNQRECTQITQTSQQRTETDRTAVLKQKPQKRSGKTSITAKENKLGLQKNSGLREHFRKAEMLKSKSVQKGTAVMTREQMEVFLKVSNKKSTSDVEIRQNTSKNLTSTEEDCNNAENQESSSLENTEKPTHCKYCAQTFRSLKEFNKHRKNPILNYHVCLKCNVAFPFKAYLLAHLKYHNKTGERSSYDCENCKFKTSNFNDLKRHMMIHTHERTFRCCQCLKTYMTHTKLMTHLATHRPKGLIKCASCDEYFTSRGDLYDHQLAVHQLKCDLCDQLFPNRASRTIHYKTEHSDTIQKCPHCKGLYSEEKLAEHILKTHTQRQYKQCPICGTMVKRLDEHLRTHRSDDEIPDSELFMCDQCPMKFKKRCELKIHMQKHLNERQIKCHLCPKTFISTAGLTRHMYNVHSNLTPYQCEICGKKCKQKNNLKVHMRIHSREKMFPCNFCEQAFNYKASLISHVKSKHSSESTTGSAPNLKPVETLKVSGSLDDIDTGNCTGNGTASTLTLASGSSDTSGYSPHVISSHVQFAERSASWFGPGNTETFGWTVSQPGLNYNAYNVTSLNMQQGSIDSLL